MTAPLPSARTATRAEPLEYDAAKDAHDSYFAAIEAKRLAGKMGDWEKPSTTLHPSPSPVPTAG